MNYSLQPSQGKGGAIRVINSIEIQASNCIIPFIASCASVQPITLPFSLDEKEKIMRSRVFVGACTLLFLCAGTLCAQAPLLKDGVKIMDGSAFLEVTYCSTPTVADWNNDGAKDLIVGQFTSGYIWLYLNQGTNLNPVFNGGSKIESGGTPITTSYG
jgi:hypothetical protein